MNTVVGFVVKYNFHANDPKSKSVIKVEHRARGSPPSFPPRRCSFRSLTIYTNNDCTKIQSRIAHVAYILQINVHLESPP